MWCVGTGMIMILNGRSENVFSIFSFVGSTLLSLGAQRVLAI